jgi:WD40 repeat protein
LIITGSNDTTVKIWNATSGQLLQTFLGHENTVSSLLISPNIDIELIISGDWNGVIKTWNTLNGKLLNTWIAHSRSVNALTFLLNGNLVTGSDDYSIKIWNKTTSQLIRTLSISSGIVLNLKTLSTNGNLVVGTGYPGCVIQVWNPLTGQLIQTISNQMPVLSLTLLSLNLIATGSIGSGITIWDLNINKVNKSLNSYSSALVNSLAVFQNDYLISSFYDEIQIWNLVTDKLIQTIKNPNSDTNEWIGIVNVQQNNAYLVRASSDSTIRIWKPENN